MKAEYWSSPVLPLLAAIGLFRPLLSANLGMAGTRILGPTISSTLSATAPLFGVALGVVLLSEPLTPAVAIGTTGIVIAVVVLSWRGGAHRTWPLVALLLPVGAAFLRSLAHAFAKVRVGSIAKPLLCRLDCLLRLFPPWRSRTMDFGASSARVSPWPDTNGW